MYGLSLVAESGDYSLVALHGFLIAVASRVAVHGLRALTECGILLKQRLNLHPMHWQVDSYPLCHQGSSVCLFNKW